MSKKLLGEIAVERLGYYVCALLRDARDLYEDVDVEEAVWNILGDDYRNEINWIHPMLSDQEDTPVIRTRDELDAMANAFSTGGNQISLIVTNTEFRDQWFSGGDDISFYLLEMAVTMGALLELLDELDPLGDCTVDYIKAFTQSF